MGALFMQKVGMANFHDHLENSRDVWKFAEELFGDDDMNYAVGFDHGYEGLESPNSSEIYLAGYECGRIVYEEFHGEASQSILSSSEEEEVHSPSETISMA